jgi:hypothetical protein
MNYWKKLKIKDLEIIQNKTLEYMKSNRSKFAPNTPFQPIDFKEYVEAVPEFLTAFSDYGLTPRSVAVYIMFSNPDGAAHRDYLTDRARINLPIINCENSWTNFYTLKNPDSKPKISINAKGQPYQSYAPDDIVLVDRVQITEPTIIRPLEIHSIEMDETKVPRITLTICTDPMPEFLLVD